MDNNIVEVDELLDDVFLFLVQKKCGRPYLHEPHFLRGLTSPGKFIPNAE
jgi:hypothetical protein